MTDSFAGWLTAQVDITLHEVQQRCQEHLGVQIGLNALCHRIDRPDLSYKKRRAPRSKIDPDYIGELL